MLSVNYIKHYDTMSKVPSLHSSSMIVHPASSLGDPLACLLPLHTSLLLPSPCSCSLCFLVLDSLLCRFRSSRLSCPLPPDGATATLLAPPHLHPPLLSSEQTCHGESVWAGFIRASRHVGLPLASQGLPPVPSDEAQKGEGGREGGRFIYNPVESRLLKRNHPRRCRAHRPLSGGRTVPPITKGNTSRTRLLWT